MSESRKSRKERRRTSLSPPKQTPVRGIIDPADSLWGTVDNLTPDYYSTLTQFTSWASEQTDAQKQWSDSPPDPSPPTVLRTIHTFPLTESLPSACLRWLRARKFSLVETKRMVLRARMLRCVELGDSRPHTAYADEAAPLVADKLSVHPGSPHYNDYWRQGGWFDAKDAAPGDKTAPPLDAFLDSYPQGYFGSSKLDAKTQTACPLWICKVGKINTPNLSTFTSMRTVLQYHWYAMEVALSSALVSTSATYNLNPIESRCLVILDLKNLTLRDCTNSVSLAIVKTQAAVDSLAYPETMFRSVIKDPPGFFKMTWALIKGWVDARTASKIELQSGRRGIERIVELCDPATLPSDYGGREINRATSVIYGGSIDEDADASSPPSPPCDETLLKTQVKLINVGGKRLASCTGHSHPLTIDRDDTHLQASVHTMCHSLSSTFTLQVLKRNIVVGKAKDGDWEDVTSPVAVINNNPKAIENDAEFKTPDTDPHYNEPVGVILGFVPVAKGRTYRIKGVAEKSWGSHDYLTVLRVRDVN